MLELIRQYLEGNEEMLSSIKDIAVFNCELGEGNLGNIEIGLRGILLRFFRIRLQETCVFHFENFQAWGYLWVGGMQLYRIANLY
jgi:hypothetical protein